MAFDFDQPPEDLEGLRHYVYQHFQRLAEMVNAAEDGAQVKVNVEPAKPRDGHLKYADGTNWDPGYGEGFYWYDGAAWQYSMTWTAFIANYRQLQNYAADTGTGAAYAAAFSPVFSSVPTGTTLFVKVGNTNTVANPTFSPDGIAAETITKFGGQALEVGDIVSGMVMELCKRATGYELVNPALVVRVDKRQTVLTGSVSSGLPDFLSASGLNISLSASSDSPVTFTWAAGYNGIQLDYVATKTAAWSNQWTVEDGFLSYLYVDRNSSTGAVTAGVTKVPWQCSETFNVGRQALLHFEGTDGAVTTSCEYGNTIAFSGNAQIDTAQFQFGSSSLLLDGTGDYISLSDVKDLGSRGWTLECFTRRSVTGAFHAIFSGPTAGSLLLRYTDTNVLQLYLGDDGVNWNIVSGSTSVATYTSGVWYHVALVRDPVLQYYYVYVGGTKVIEASSALEVVSLAHATAALSGLHVGVYRPVPDSYFNGWIDEVCYTPYCKYPAGTAFTPPAQALSKETLYWFDLQQQKMFQGDPSAWTAIQRLFIADAAATAGAVSSLRTYALRGEFYKRFPIAASTRYTIDHNLGVVPREIHHKGFGNRVGDWREIYESASYGAYLGDVDEVAAYLNTQSNIEMAGSLPSDFPNAREAIVKLGRGW